MKYFIVDKSYKHLYSNIIFDVDNKERRYIRPTMNGEIIGALSTEENVNYDIVIDKLSHLTGKVDAKKH